MLVLSRKIGENLIIDGNIKIRVMEVKGNRVRLGIEAPADVSIVREELCLLAPDSDRRSNPPFSG